MHALAMRDHHVVVGVGKVGYRIINELVGLSEDVVAIEHRMDTPLVSDIQDLGIPVLKGDGRQRKILEQANTAKARSVLLVTDDDLANLDAALTAREINPDVRVVVRLFDDTLATKVATVFKMPAISTSQTSSPAFVAAATGRNVYHSFQLDGLQLQMADMTVEKGSRLVGKSIGELQKLPGLNVVMHHRAGVKDVGPSTRSSSSRRTRSC